MTNVILYNEIKKQFIETNSDDAITKLYFQEYIFPTKKIIQKNKNEFWDDNVDNIYETQKNNISNLNYLMPLYEIYHDNLYLIQKENVYTRVVKYHYRFLGKNLIIKIINKYNKNKNILNKINKEELIIAIKNALLKNDEVKYQKLQNDFNLYTKVTKYKLMLKFMKSFNIKKLFDVYLHFFYEYDPLSKSLTTCMRPSFINYMKHIEPYYKRSEIINLGLNMDLIKISNIYYDKKKLYSLCEKIIENDISRKIIIAHQNHIINENKIGLIQYYSFMGSSLINHYLRTQETYIFKNELIENITLSMNNLIINAPAFDKDYILYRFVNNDSYISDLKINDIFTEYGFMSTTRDPFYKASSYKFGTILIKIRIPKNIIGVALCMETYSHFPYEEEIIFPPMSQFKLVRKDKNVIYYHTDENFGQNINTRYEFAYIGRENISFKNKKKPNIKYIDFLNLEKYDNYDLETKLEKFIDIYARDINQFEIKLNNITIPVIIDTFDSTGAYYDYYALTTKKGYIMYAIQNDSILFMIELGKNSEEINTTQINFYMRYSLSINNEFINSDDFLNLITSISYYFGINIILIYLQYISCDYIERNNLNKNQIIENKVYGGHYCNDFYNYLKKNEKRYTIPEIKTGFLYTSLDELYKISSKIILKQDDQDELFQLYKIYIRTGMEDKLANFYLWLCEHHCYLVDILVEKMNRYFKINNPFDNDYYILDPLTYLYNNNYIKFLPMIELNRTLFIKETLKREKPKPIEITRKTRALN